MKEDEISEEMNSLHVPRYDSSECRFHSTPLHVHPPSPVPGKITLPPCALLTPTLPNEPGSNNVLMLVGFSMPKQSVTVSLIHDRIESYATAGDVNLG